MTKSEIRDKQIMSPEHYFLKLQAAGIIFEKLLGWTVFKNPNFIVLTLTNNENIKAMEILK